MRARKRFFGSAWGNVEEKFTDEHAVARELALEGADDFEALRPEVLGQQFTRQLLLGQNYRAVALLTL